MRSIDYHRSSSYLSRYQEVLLSRGNEQDASEAGHLAELLHVRATNTDELRLAELVLRWTNTKLRAIQVFRLATGMSLMDAKKTLEQHSWYKDHA